MSFIHWTLLAKRRLVSYARNFGFLNSKKKKNCFPLFHFFLAPCSAVLFLGFSFHGEFLTLFSFFRFGSLFATLDHSLRNFFLGVCHTAESECRPISFGDLIPSSCVLHRLSEELFALVSPVLSTWRAVRESMASQGGSWSSVRSEDLPRGLFDRDDGSRSSEETPSVSGSSKAVGPGNSWIARS